MKELSIEQKAQRYDEAIAHAKKLLKTIGNATLGNLVLKNEFEIMFPELKESEDERIRKELIEQVIYIVPDKNEVDDNGNTLPCYTTRIDKYIAWLEKQGEENLADNVKSKFKVGDWIVYKDTVWEVCNISLLNYYELLKINNEVSTKSIEDVDKTARLWTIQDVRNGDIFVDENNNIGLYREEKDDLYWESYIYLGCDGKLYGFNIGGYHRNKNTKPATKEQRDLLFSKMKEEGYEWDDEKKELKKIKQKHTPKYKVGDTIYYNSFGEVKSMIVANVVTDNTDNPMYEDENGNAVFEKDLIEQKSAWSEEDELKRNTLIDVVKKQKGSAIFEGLLPEELTDWLEFLKDRVQPQNLTVTDEELSQAKHYAYNDALGKIEWRNGEPTFDDGWSENKKLYTIDVYYPTCGSEVKEAIEQGIAYSKTEKKEILISLNGIFLRITPSSTTENVINEYNNYAGKNTVIKEKTNFINQWNNDDELYLKGVITDIECEVLCANCSREIADLKIHWLKSLKDRVQPQVEWGEWGKKYIASTIKMVEHCSFSSIGGITKAAAITWLKSLRPQTTWKPSEEQFKSLKEVIDVGHFTSYPNALETLYEQLKQL